MKKTLIYHPSVIFSTADKSSPELFEKSIEAFESGDYISALNDLLDSIDPDIRKKQVQGNSGEYTIPHGPLLIRLSFDETDFHLSVPLVTIPAAEKIALLRQVAVINFSDLDLSRLTLQKEGLYFRFSCPLAFCHPLKLRRIFQEICRTGEKYDYIFLDQFRVKRIVTPCFKPYTPENRQYVYQVIQESCRECAEGIKYFENSRRFQEVWTLLRITFLKLIYVAHPQGKLRHLLEQAVCDLDRKLPTAELNAEGKCVIRRLQKKTPEEISKDLYAVETFIAKKKRSNLQNLRENYESCYKQVSAWMESGDYRKVCLGIIHKLYETYYLNQMDDDLNVLYTRVLKETSAQPWDIAARILYRLFDNIMQGRIKRDTPPVAA